MEDDQQRELEILDPIDPESLKPEILKDYERRLKEAGGKHHLVDGNARKRMTGLAFTPDRAMRIIHLIRQGAPNRTAALATGITEDAFYKWMQKGREGREGYDQFVVEVEKAQAQGEIERLNRISDAAINGNWQADAWYLERRYPERYGKKDRVDVGGTEEPIKVKLSW